MKIGQWGQAEDLVGVVAAVDAAGTTLFDPAGRRSLRAGPGAVRPVPAMALRVTVTVDLPVAHGLSESDLRRWVAVLTDEVLRERAREALAAAGLDEGPALAQVAVTVGPAPGEGAVCLAGHRVPAAGACPECGREAVAPPAAGG